MIKQLNKIITGTHRLMSGGEDGHQGLSQSGVRFNLSDSNNLDNSRSQYLASQGNSHYVLDDISMSDSSSNHGEMEVVAAAADDDEELEKKSSSFWAALKNVRKFQQNRVTEFGFLKAAFEDVYLLDSTFLKKEDHNKFMDFLGYKFSSSAHPYAAIYYFFGCNLDYEFDKYTLPRIAYNIYKLPLFVLRVVDFACRAYISSNSFENYFNKWTSGILKDINLSLDDINANISQRTVWERFSKFWYRMYLRSCTLIPRAGVSISYVSLVIAWPLEKISKATFLILRSSMCFFDSIKKANNINPVLAIASGIVGIFGMAALGFVSGGTTLAIPAVGVIPAAPAIISSFSASTSMIAMAAIVGCANICASVKKIAKKIKENTSTEVVATDHSRDFPQSNNNSDYAHIVETLIANRRNNPSLVDSQNTQNQRDVSVYIDAEGSDNSSPNSPTAFDLSGNNEAAALLVNSQKTVRFSNQPVSSSFSF